MLAIFRWRRVGGIGVAWCVAFWFLVYETPDEHPRISREEHTYIMEAMGVEMFDKHVSKNLYSLCGGEQF